MLPRADGVLGQPLPDGGAGVLATNPHLITSAWMSGTWRRDRGKPICPGSTQAIVLTATTSSGGGDRPAARAFALCQAGKAPLEEAIALLADELAAGVESLGNLVVAQATSSQEDHMSPEHIPIRQGISTRPGPERLAFLGAKPDLKRTRSWRLASMPQATAIRAGYLRASN